jgi:hypothetical protein
MRRTRGSEELLIAATRGGGGAAVHMEDPLALLQPLQLPGCYYVVTAAPSWKSQVKELAFFLIFWGGERLTVGVSSLILYCLQKILISHIFIMERKIIYRGNKLFVNAVFWIWVRMWWNTELVHTANEGPVRIQYKCLVPIFVFLEMKLCSLFPQKNYNARSPNSFTHIFVRDLYISRIVLSILLQSNMWTDPGNI